LSCLRAGYANRIGPDFAAHVRARLFLAGNFETELDRAPLSAVASLHHSRFLPMGIRRALQEVDMPIRRVSAVVCTGILAATCALFLPYISPGVTDVFAGTLLPYGNCAAPSQAGIAICEPGEPNSFAWETSTPFQVIAAATSGTAQVQFMELWADGKKVAQADGAPFDEAVNLPAGTHTLTLIEHDVTGTEIKSAPFELAVEGNDHPACNAPASPGLNVCSPNSGGCNTEPWVDFDAVGKGASGSVDRMELWIEGTRIANFPGDRISTSLIMAYGEIGIVEVDTAGHSISKSFSFNGPC